MQSMDNYLGSMFLHNLFFDMTLNCNYSNFITWKKWLHQKRVANNMVESFLLGGFVALKRAFVIEGL
jgi:hypothetical protein